MKYKLSSVALLFIFLGIAISAHAQKDRRDGNWWLSTDKTIRLGYVVGFLDGIHLGQRFSYWKLVDDAESAPCLKKVLLASSEYEDKYLRNVKIVQLNDGLNDFFSDYKNRRIEVDDAIWLVLN
ncbi:MAG: hypothetical protein QOH42_1085, partial [Blastocatellia bacterium]|nr:hypothetical protein [Blastocatellia bacterium]